MTQSFFSNGKKLTAPQALYIEILSEGHKIKHTEREGNVIKIWLDTHNWGSLFPYFLMPVVDMKLK